VLRQDAFLDLLDRPCAAGAGTQRRERVLIGGKDENPVLQVQLLPPVVEVRLKSTSIIPTRLP